MRLRSRGRAGRNAPRGCSRDRLRPPGRAVVVTITDPGHKWRPRGRVEWSRTCAARGGSHPVGPVRVRTDHRVHDAGGAVAVTVWIRPCPYYRIVAIGASKDARHGAQHSRGVAPSFRSRRRELTVSERTSCDHQRYPDDPQPDLRTRPQHCGAQAWVVSAPAGRVTVSPIERSAPTVRRTFRFEYHRRTRVGPCQGAIQPCA